MVAPVPNWGMPSTTGFELFPTVLHFTPVVLWKQEKGRRRGSPIEQSARLWSIVLSLQGHRNVCTHLRRTSYPIFSTYSGTRITCCFTALLITLGTRDFKASPLGVLHKDLGCSISVLSAVPLPPHAVLSQVSTRTSSFAADSGRDYPIFSLSSRLSEICFQRCRI